MQVRVDRLRETLKLLQPVIPRKSALPVLKNILLRDGEAIATDLEVMVIFELPEAEGQYLIPHHSAQELLKYVPGNELLSIDQAKKSLNLSWGGGKASYDVVHPKEYPPVPEVKARVEGTVGGDSFVAVLSSVVDYCTTDVTRPVLSGVSLSLGETIEVCAGDGFRMAYHILPISFPAEDRVIIPAHSVRVLGDLWGRVPPAVPLGNSLVRQVTAKRQLQLTLGDGRVVARFGRVTLLSKLIEGAAPNFSQLIPQDPPLKVVVFAPELERAVRRVKEIAKDGKGIVRLTWTETAMTVSAKSDEKGKAEAEVPVQTEGGTGRVAVNVSYLLDYLNGKEGVVSIGVRGVQDPVLFRHGTSPLVVIMPMLVQ